MSAEIAAGKHPPVVSHLMQFRIVATVIEMKRCRLVRLRLSKADHAGRRCVPPINSAEQTGAGTQHEDVERRIEVPQPRFGFRKTAGQVVSRRYGDLQ